MAHIFSIVDELTLTPESPRLPYSFSKTQAPTWTNGLYEFLEFVVTTTPADVSFNISNPANIILYNAGGANVRYGPKSGGVRIDFGMLIPGLVNKISIDTVGTFTLRWEAVSGSQTVQAIVIGT